MQNRVGGNQYFNVVLNFFTKIIPSEMEVAPRYELLTLLTLLTWRTLSIWFTLLKCFTLYRVVFYCSALKND